MKNLKNAKIKKDCGAYRILCTQNGRSYFGMSTNLKERIDSHMTRLNNGWHHCKELQAHFEKYGKEKFVIEILKYTEDYKSAALAECEFIMKASKNNPPYNFSGGKKNPTTSTSKGITTTSIAFKFDILEGLKDHAESIDRSVSWIVNTLVEKLLDGKITID